MTLVNDKTPAVAGVLWVLLPHLDSNQEPSD